jgi:hypothetical protein
MAEQDAHILEVLVSQMRQHRDIDAVLGEALAVLGQAEFFEPIRNPLHRRPRSGPVGQFTIRATVSLGQNLVPQDFTPEDATEALKQDTTAEQAGVLLKCLTVPQRTGGISDGACNLLQSLQARVFFAGLRFPVGGTDSHRFGSRKPSYIAHIPTSTEAVH